MSRQTKPTPPVPSLSSEPGPSEGGELWQTPSGRLALRLDELAERLGVSRRTLERERSAGRFPKPDLHIGKMPLWQPATVQAWIDRGGS